MKWVHGTKGQLWSGHGRFRPQADRRTDKVKPIYLRPHPHPPHTHTHRHTSLDFFNIDQTQSVMRWNQKNSHQLVQDCSISIANALDILQSCTKPSNISKRNFDVRTAFCYYVTCCDRPLLGVHYCPPCDAVNEPYANKTTNISH